MRKITGALAALALLGGQAAAAADLDFGDGRVRHSGAFVGAYLKLPLTGARAAPPAAHAGLKLSLVHQYRDSRAPLARYEADALDLRLGAEAQPTLHIAGQPLATDRLGYADADAAEERGFNWWIPVAVLGGAALIGGAVFLAKVAEGNRNSD